MKGLVDSSVEGGIWTLFGSQPPHIIIELKQWALRTKQPCCNEKKREAELISSSLIRPKVLCRNFLEVELRKTAT
jgi:hypothetical protein